MSTEPTQPQTSTSTVCQGCGKSFESRNAVFRHLRKTTGSCLSHDDHAAFHSYMLQHSLEKTVVLYGYLPTSVCECGRESEDDSKLASRAPLHNGDDAAKLLLQALNASDKINRSYGCQGQATDIVKQDEETGTICEVLATKLPPLTTSLEEWIDIVERKLSTLTTGKVKVCGRLEMPMKKFNAEMDKTHVRMEYLLPADFLFVGTSREERRAFFDSLSNFGVKDNSTTTTNINRPSQETLSYLYKLKKLMQLLTTRVVDLEDDSDPMAVKEIERRRRNRTRGGKKPRDDDKNKLGDKSNENSDSEEDTSVVHGDDNEDDANEDTNGTKDATRRKTGNRKLRRRSFHNFTPRVMAHEFLAYRRLDRFHHKATMRFNLVEDEEPGRPFLALSLSGDLFLHGQAVRVFGLWLALARGMIDPEIVDCVFDEDYPHLVPTPAVPSFALYAAEASYMSWEGKTKLILSPRKTNRYEDGWNNDKTIQAVSEWESEVHETTAKAWRKEGVDKDGRLVAEREWTEQVLKPWVERAKEQLKDYRLWKALQLADNDNSSNTPMAILPPLSSIDPSVPKIFEKVLFHLRKADASGLWPSTTPNRQLVMVSTPLSSDCDTTTSLSVARMRAKENSEERRSAYDFALGQGGASGSFSVGAFPGDEQNQPKANTVFPELVEAAFELEIALCPDREPSSTIAINRNAQFRPHTDSGAGAGQSTSLIVGLGRYVGGELVVEGEKKDIRYKPLEFNGWTQRHWTMPFDGERYSLVWFTPKGCENKRYRR